jgi:hypothetical protein
VPTCAGSRSRCARRPWPACSAKHVTAFALMNTSSIRRAFRHACKMGPEGIVSKRLGSRYRSGRSPDWLKFKKPDAPAVRRDGGRGLGEVVTIKSHFKHNVFTVDEVGKTSNTSAELKITCWRRSSTKSQ